MQNIEFKPLLTHLHETSRGEFIANLSVQTKVEKFLLADIAFAANAIHPGLEFWMEESPRRDLTIRHRINHGPGPLLEWVEAKMCYSDCVARAITKRANKDEYCEQVERDVRKQNNALLSSNDKDARLTAALFVIHRSAPHERHIYYPNFKNRKQLVPEDIRREAVRFCTNNISSAAGRSLDEQVEVRLDSTTELLGFFYRRPNIA